MKIAIVTDWLVVYGGAERVLEQILKIYPNADLFALIDFLPDKKRFFIQNKQVNTSFIQKLPFSKKKYRNYLPLMPLAIEQLDLSKYDMIISSSYAVAKGVITGPNQLHISYCHSPIRYAWDLQFQYLKEAGLDKGIKSWLVRYILHKLRIWDYRTSNGVDYFIANSYFVRRRIWKTYRRNSYVIYPPVSVNDFEFQNKKDEFYLTVSRLVPYKRVDLIIKAFTTMSDKKLVVIGDGPDYKKLKKIASKNVLLLGYQSFEVLKKYMQNARAFIFAAEEDFGIVPLEAQACGTPVIAYGGGGSLETIKGMDYQKPTGLFFKEQTVESLRNTIKMFENNITTFDPRACRENALRFSEQKFRYNFQKFVEEKIFENKEKNTSKC